jgi:hypothetical protein
MNIYLDVDGVLLDKHLQPAQCLHEFVQYVTTHHTCYWATTHVTDGSTEHLFRVLARQQVPPETLALLPQIQGTSWDLLKTEVIDFTQPFLWFEDMPTTGEQAILKKHNAEASLIWVDRAKGDGLCRWLGEQEQHQEAV